MRLILNKQETEELILTAVQNLKLLDSGKEYRVSIKEYSQDYLTIDELKPEKAVQEDANDKPIDLGALDFINPDKEVA